MTLKLSLVIAAIDQATEPVRRINRALDSLAAGPRAIASAMGRLAGEVGLTTVANRAGNAITALGTAGQAATQFGLRLAGIAGIGGGGLLGIVKHTANASEEILLASQRLGIGIEQYQKLAFAAEQSGVRQEQFGEALKFLAANAVEAATGSQEAAQWFRAAGVSVKDAHGRLKGTDQLFLELADAFQKSNKDAEKVKVAMSLLGRAGADMIPVMNTGAAGIRDLGKQAEDFGLVRSAAAIRAGEEFGDKLNVLARMIGAVGTLIGDKLIAKLDPLADQLIDLGKAMMPIIDTKIDEWIASFEAALPTLIDELSNFGGTVTSVMSVVSSIAETFGWGTTAAVALGLYLGGPLIAAVANVGVAIALLGSSLVGVIAKLGALVFAAGPIGLIVAAVAALAAAAFYVYRNWDFFSQKFAEIWDGAVAKVDAAVAAIKSVFGGIGEWISRQIETITNLIPDWAKKPLGISLPTASGSAAGSAAANFAPPAAPVLGPSAPTLGPPVPTVGAARAQAPFEGELTVRLEGPGAEGASVEQLRSNSSSFDIGVDLGTNMVMP